MGKFKCEITGINTSNLKVLSNEEMLPLFKKFKDGDLLAKEQLIQGNLKLVLSVISKYRHKNIDMNDLFQVGVIGLIKAVENFDTGYNVMFSTYAVPLILGEVKRLIRTNSSLRIARSIRDTAYQVLKFKEEYIALNGIEPSYEIMSKSLNLTEGDIKYALDALSEPVSIFEPIYNDGGDTIFLIDQIPENKDYTKDKELYMSMKEALNKLKKRERDILICRYIYGETQSEMANKFKVSQAQISRIEKQALENARKLME